MLGFEPRSGELHSEGSFSGLSTFIFCYSESGDFLTGIREELYVLTGVSTSSDFGKGLAELTYN